MDVWLVCGGRIVFVIVSKTPESLAECFDGKELFYKRKHDRNLISIITFLPTKFLVDWYEFCKEFAEVFLKLLACL